MTALNPAQPRFEPSRFDPWILTWMGVLGALVGYGYCVFEFLRGGEWWIGAGGRPADLDFVCFWAAGKLVVAGRALAAYDAGALATWSEHARGYPFLYPPAYLFVVAPLGLLPFTAAAGVAVAATGAAYLAAVRAIAPRAAVVALAAAAPAAFFNVYVGQNGLLTAALFGGALVLLDKRPIAAGLLIAALAYKPQFGPLIPLVLALTGRWRAFGAAAAGVVALNLAAGAVFGPDVFAAFFRALGFVQGSLLDAGGLPVWKVQSLYGGARWLGASAPVAWALHGALALAVVAGLAALWRSEAPYALKAAALPVAALLLSPYSLMYDFVLLSIPVAFLIRDAERAAMTPLEVAGLGLVMVAPLFFILGAPLGVPVNLLAAALIAQRWRRWSHEASAQPPAALPAGAWQTTPPPVPS